MVKMKNSEVKMLHVLMGKAGATIEPIPCWEMSSRVLALEDLIEPLKKAEAELPRVKEYGQKRNKLMAEYKKFIGEFQDPFGNMIARFDKKDDESESIFIAKSSELYNEYKDDLDADANRRVKIEKLMDIDVDVDIEPIVFDWLLDANGKNLLNGNEVTFLRKHNLVVRNNNVSKDNDDKKVTNIKK